MAKIEKSIEIDVPVHTAYNQWTQFEDFPHFMEGVKEVRQIDDKRLHWRAEVGGKEKEWDAEIAEQTPDSRIAWHSTNGPRNAGQVSFHRLGDNRTRISLLLDYEPEGVIEKAGDALGVVSGRVEGDLDRFKEFIESRGRESGAWRGEIHGGQKTKSGSTGGSGSMGGSSGSMGGPGSSGSRGGSTSSRGSVPPSGGSAGSRGSTGGSTKRSGAKRVDPEEKDDDLGDTTPGI